MKQVRVTRKKRKPRDDDLREEYHDPAIRAAKENARKKRP